ncbi:MAG: APC family permease [Opitutaceae bacterium]|nr:APC family permease [Opitutaceae bacterium]
MSNPSSPSAAPTLRRSLGLGSLVLYGIILIQPTAPMPLFGVAYEKAGGHVITLILIGMVAMLFTALSYGRMANAYPNAGSAYAYVSREFHPAPGYLTGWSMMFDYMINPAICVIWCSKATFDVTAGLGTLHLPGLALDLGFIHQIPQHVWFVFYAALFTGLNLRGIEASARTNMLIGTGLGLVILLFLAAAWRHLFREHPLDAAALARPFYDPESFSWKSISSGAALAVLTYIGFDGISTLSEEVHNPRRNVLLATVLVCLIIGVLSSIEVYTAQLVWARPAADFPNLENAFAHVAGLVGGKGLFVLVTVALLIATIGSGMGAHMSAGRLLYGMGRDNAIPRKFFGYVHPRTRVPSNNILLVGAIALIGAFALDYDQRGYDLGAQLLNFGAMFGFMGVNLSALTHYYIRAKDRRLSQLIPPILGFLICFYLWVSLSGLSLIIGSCWLVVGALYGAWRTRLFTRQLDFARPASAGEVNPGDSSSPK